MKTLNNYIVALYGVAQDFQTNEILIVTELMKTGDLKNWLRSSKNIPDEKIVISFANDICREMSFLEQRVRVHRNLACRNLLISAEGNTIKIADFGLSALVNKDDFAQRDDPYPDEKDFASIRTLVLNGYIHKKPLKCSNQFYNQLILPCLWYEPNQRPNFKSLLELLSQWDKVKAEYERLNRPYEKFFL
ncbi:unnamed protein product [Rotaria sordida]|uniref:Protein kinase domain-containing protein n=1 Tax=Rotaria sordida TaxID=392033 RepID=A0A813VRH5_9BILA|nr:unnamed protein product [Rotaria sordida]